MYPNVRGKRIGAAIIDNILTAFLSFILYIIALIISNNLNLISQNSVMIYVIIIQPTTFFICHTLIPYFTKGSTLGKLMVGLKVVGLDYHNPTFIQLLLRNIRLILVFFTTVLPYGLYLAFQTDYVLISTLIGFFLNFAVQLTILIMILSNEEERAFHDMIANTYVVPRNFDILKVTEVNALERQYMDWAIFEDEELPTPEVVDSLKNEDDDIEILKKD